MLPYIFNSNFEPIGMFENYISFIWTSRYYATGDFQLTLPITDEIVSMVNSGAYIGRQDSNEYGIIERREFSKVERLEDSESVLVISGRFLTGILARRIVEKQTQLNGNAGECIRKLIDENVINPTMTVRKIDGVGVENMTTGHTMSQQVTGKNLMEIVESILSEQGIGYRCSANKNGKKFLIEIYEGIDRTAGQSINPRVVFSTEYDNLESSNYIEDKSTTVTDVLVAGEGEGLARKTIWASAKKNTDLARWEIYQDARNASTNNGEISDTVYFQQLKQDGMESLTDFSSLFSGNVSFQNIRLGDDVSLGDLVTIENKKWGMQANVRLIELIESVDSSGVHELVTTFGV